MKNLYAIDQTNGGLVQKTDAGWAVVAGSGMTVGAYDTAAPNTWKWPSSDAVRSAAGLFVYRGQLFQRFRNLDLAGSTAADYFFIRRWTGTAFENVAKCTLTGSRDSTSYSGMHWGPAVQYRDKIYWLGSTFSHYLNLAAFWYDESSGAYALHSHICTELLWAAYDSSQGGSAADDDHAFFGPQLAALNDQLGLFTRGVGHNSTNGYLYFNDWIGPVDIDPTTHAATLKRLFVSDPNAKAITVVRGGSTLLTKAQIDHLMVGACEWQGKVYALSAYGLLSTIDPYTNQKADVLDLADHAHATAFAGQAWRAGTTSAAASNSLINVTSQEYYEWQTYAIGTCIWIQDFPTGQATRGWVNRSNNTSTIYAIQADGTVIQQVPAGKTVTGTTGFGMAATNSCRDRIVYMFTYNGKLHIFNAPFWAESGNRTRYMPWTLHVWDGTGSPSQYVVSTLAMAAEHFRFVLDEADGKLHIIYRLANGADTVQHDVLNLASPDVVTSVGAIPNAYNQYGSPIDSVAAFDTGDVMAAFDSSVVDPAAGATTLTYRLFGPATETVDISMEVNDGHGWEVAVGASGEPSHEGVAGLTAAPHPSGDQHVFIHDFQGQGMPYDDSAFAQYRIRIANQVHAP